MAAPVIHSDPEVLGGTPVFVGTRVPLRNLIDCLERGHSLEQFLDEFPSVSREQAVAALEAAHEALEQNVRSGRPQTMVSEASTFPLRGTAVQYQQPTDPVASEDWKTAR